MFTGIQSCKISLSIKVSYESKQKEKERNKLFNLTVFTVYCLMSLMQFTQTMNVLRSID